MAQGSRGADAGSMKPWLPADSVARVPWFLQARYALFFELLHMMNADQGNGEISGRRKFAGKTLAEANSVQPDNDAYYPN